MFIKKTATVLLVLVTSASVLVHAQESNSVTSSQDKTRASESSEEVSNLKQKEALQAEILKMQASNKQTEEDIVATQAALSKAQQKCRETCTKQEISDLLYKVQDLSQKATIAMGIFGGAKIVIGVLGNELGAKTFSTFGQPLKSLSGIAFYGSLAAYTISTQLKNLMEKRDMYSMNEITALSGYLQSYKNKLNQTQTNLDVTSKALEQMIRLEQAGVAK